MSDMSDMPEDSENEAEREREPGRAGPENTTDTRRDGAPQRGPFIRLDRFLKWTGVVGTGGEAKFRVQEGEVEVNDETESRRGRKLVPGDRVRIGDTELVVPDDLG